METWKIIVGWPYEVSSEGRVRNATGKILTPRLHTNGYHRVQLCRLGRRREEYIHRLVCEAFHGPANGRHVDHVNFDRADNRSENLRWVEPVFNLAHRRIAKGERHYAAKLTASDVSKIRLLFSTKSNSMIASTFGVHRRTISDIRNGVSWND